MGQYVIRMPDIGEGIAEVEIVEWHIKEGDHVVEDQVIADVMTDKATVQVPTPVSGKVLRLGGKVGELMPVGSELICLEVEGGAGNVDQASGREAGAVQAPSSSSPPTGAQPRFSARSPAQRGRVLAAPSVRRRAMEEGIDLRSVPPTGAAGQVTHEDLDQWLLHGGLSPAAAGGIVAPRSGVSLHARREGIEEISVVGLRRKIAQKMQESKRRIPHFTYVKEIDVTELESLRAQLNAKWADSRGRLTLLPFLVRALVRAVSEFPQMNARYDEEKGVVQRYAPVHLGVAAQTEAGLMVPVLRHAEAHDLWACASEIRRLAEAVRAGTANRDELSGSTITITSLGALGGIVSTPVINHPEVAIVGVNRVVERPVVRGGAVVVRNMMNLSSSFDHRVVDGMHAAEFIQCVRAYLESPATLFVE